MIYSIGYSNRSLPEFLQELSERDIRQIWDVRSSPWSRNAAFNASQIVQWSERAGIYYRNCGEVLGGRSQINIGTSAYKDCLNQLVLAANRENTVIMCAEGDPASCHRTWDIGACLLLFWQVPTISILRNGEIEDIRDTLKRVRKGNFSPLILAELDNELPF